MDDITTNIETLIETIRQLRGENGCPWDKRQTTKSLKKYLKEEFDEIIQAIDQEDNENLCEELGDFLYLIIMISEINQQKDTFALDDVITLINEKLIRRHPHVFAGVKITNEKDLKSQWEEIKRIEKKQLTKSSIVS